MKTFLYRFVSPLLASIVFVATANATGVDHDHDWAAKQNWSDFTDWEQHYERPVWEGFESKTSRLSEFLQSRDWPTEFGGEGGIDWSKLEYGDWERDDWLNKLASNEKFSSLKERFLLNAPVEFQERWNIFENYAHDKGVGASPVPLPASVWLLLSGCGVLAFFAHRRKNSIEGNESNCSNIAAV